MGVFKPDLFRALGIGFAIGTLAVAAIAASTHSAADMLAPPAVAQTAR